MKTYGTTLGMVKKVVLLNNVQKGNKRTIVRARKVQQKQTIKRALTRCEHKLMEQ